MWAEAIHTIVDEDLTSQGAPPDFTSHNWWWQLEALSNPAE
jgi:hypothetical protein